MTGTPSAHASAAPSGRSEREAAFVLPMGSLAAAGPPLDLSTLRSPYYADDERSRFEPVTRALQMLAATAVGLALLVLPMALLAGVARDVYDTATARSSSVAPGEAPQWRAPGSTLTPAGR